METAVAVKQNNAMFFDPNAFEFAQRVANVFAKSDMVPAHFKGNVGNCMIAMDFAQRINADVFMVMQNMYVIKGRPGIEGKMVIGLVNNSGRFEPLEFEQDDDGCTAVAKDIKSGKVLRGPTVSWTMVKAEGWLSKGGSKWKTMPDLMFKYRSATYFARVYCPEVLLGMQTREEIEDVINVTPVSSLDSIKEQIRVPDLMEVVDVEEVVPPEQEESVEDIPAQEESTETAEQIYFCPNTDEEVKSTICDECKDKKTCKEHS
jgi:hypothetical protein